jgi:hypothetical protein
MEKGSPAMSVPQYGDYQYEIYTDGLNGRLPKYPVDFTSLERAASEVLPTSFGPTSRVAVVTRARSGPT